MLFSAARVTPRRSTESEMEAFRGWDAPCNMRGVHDAGGLSSRLSFSPCPHTSWCCCDRALRVRVCRFLPQRQGYALSRGCAFALHPRTVSSGAEKSTVSKVKDNIYTPLRKLLRDGQRTTKWYLSFMFTFSKTVIEFKKTLNLSKVK